MNELIIEIKGVNFSNKGAELMMLAIIRALKDRFVNIKIGLTLRSGNFHDRNNYGLYHILRYDSYKYPIINKILILGNLIPKVIRKFCRFILDSEVKVVIDSSGFQYSSQWGNEATIVMAKLCEQWKKQNKKIILMPQAYGPFNNPIIVKNMQQIINKSDIIYVRDKSSQKYLNEIKAVENNIHLCNDFTNILKPKEIQNDNLNTVCIIPNYRIIDKLKSDTSDYIYFFQILIDHFIKNNIKFYFLLHEEKLPKGYKTDVEIIKVVSKLYKPSQLIVVNEDDPLEIKRIIGTASLVISSRYHGLISGLSQNVPSLATSWSHKYKELLIAYNCEKFFIDDLTDKENILSKVEFLLNVKNRNKIIKNLRSVNLKLEIQVENMWDNIFSEICPIFDK